MPEQLTTHNLIYHIARQYPAGITTWGACERCEAPARGGYLCTKCLSDELSKRCGSPELVAKLISNSKTLQTAYFERETLIDQITGVV